MIADWELLQDQLCSLLVPFLIIRKFYYEGEQQESGINEQRPLGKVRSPHSGFRLNPEREAKLQICD